LADVKISGLPASTVPLAGTEVLPIVQGGATKQVSIANITAGRAVAATSITTDTYKAASSSGGALQNSGGTPQLQWGAGGGNNLSVDVAININPANAAVAISPTGTGTVTINPATASTMNNVAIGGTTPLTGVFTTVKASTTVGVGAATPSASGAGITFPATQSASTDVNTLDDYEEGTWTPTGNGITFSVATGFYTKIGRSVTLSFSITFPTTADTNDANINSIPFTPTNLGGGSIGYSDNISVSRLFNNTGATLLLYSNAARLINANLSGNIVRGTITYFV
jgi:hypothetical protein